MHNAHVTHESHGIVCRFFRRACHESHPSSFGCARLHLDVRYQRQAAMSIRHSNTHLKGRTNRERRRAGLLFLLIFIRLSYSSTKLRQDFLSDRLNGSDRKSAKFRPSSADLFRGCESQLMIADVIIKRKRASVADAKKPKMNHLARGHNANSD